MSSEPKESIVVDLSHYVVGNKYRLCIHDNKKVIVDKQYVFTEFVNLKELFGDDPYDEIKCVLNFECGPNITDVLMLYILKSGEMSFVGLDTSLSKITAQSLVTLIKV